MYFAGVGAAVAQDDDVIILRGKQVDSLCVHFEIYYFRFYLLIIYLYEVKYQW